jgi:thioredoxin 2
MADTVTVRCPNCGRTNRIPVAEEGKPRCGNCHRPLPWIVSAGDADFDRVAAHTDVFVLVDLWATWCQPCRTVSPVLEELARDFAGRLKLVKVDVDASPAVAARFEVRAVPTLLVMRDGEVVARQPGALPKPALRQWLTEAMDARRSKASA